MSRKKEDIEKEFKRLREVKEKLKNDDIMTFMGLFKLTFRDIEEIIERKITEEEEYFFVENFNSGPQYPQDIIPYNRRIMEIFIARFPMNRERILTKLDSNPRTSNN